MSLTNHLCVGDKIIFTEQVLEEIYAAFIVRPLITLSAWEGLHTTIQEVMYFGLPFLMFKSGGIVEEISGGVNGFIMENMDPTTIVKKK